MTGALAASNGEPLHGLSSSLEELKFKNPYNFLNILKGKVNLAQDDQRFHEQQNNNLLVTPANQVRMKTLIMLSWCWCLSLPCNGKHFFLQTTKRNLEEQSTSDKRRISDETYILRHLNPELRLSDLNLSAHKQNESCRSNPERISGHTFVIPDHETRRKPMKSSKKIESKENLDTSLGMSGVQPLPPFKPFVTTPLTEKNTQNITRVLEFSDSKKEIPIHDGRLSLSRTYTPDKLSEFLEESKINLERNVLSNANLIQPNTDLLKVQNMPFLLPQSVQLRTNTDCDVDPLKVLSVDVSIHVPLNLHDNSF